MEELLRKKYDAVFLGLGTQKARLLPVEGAHLPFVLGGIDFLRAARSGEAVRVGPRVVVIGGGNVSIDVALTALRQGAKHVDLTSLEKRRDMPASPDEIELAVAEGVQLFPGWGPLRFEEEGLAVFQFCERVKDETGKFSTRIRRQSAAEARSRSRHPRRRPRNRRGLPRRQRRREHRGYVVADPKTKMTTVPGIFAGGDGQHGPRTAVEAIRSGKIAAASIDAWLSGTALDPPPARRATRRDRAPIPSWRTIALTSDAPRCPSGPSKRRSAKATTSRSSSA